MLVLHCWLQNLIGNEFQTIGVSCRLSFWRYVTRLDNTIDGLLKFEFMKMRKSSTCGGVFHPSFWSLTVGNSSFDSLFPDEGSILKVIN
jgi:hypothetical protein